MPPEICLTTDFAALIDHVYAALVCYHTTKSFFEELEPGRHVQLGGPQLATWDQIGAGRGAEADLLGNLGGRSAEVPKLAPIYNLLPPNSKYGPLASGE